jgi:hypothetical protein
MSRRFFAIIAVMAAVGGGVAALLLAPHSTDKPLPQYGSLGLTASMTIRFRPTHLCTSGRVVGKGEVIELFADSEAASLAEFRSRVDARFAAYADALQKEKACGVKVNLHRPESFLASATVRKATNHEGLCRKLSFGYRSVTVCRDSLSPTGWIKAR